MALAAQQQAYADAIKVLVVEDDNNLREALCDTLQLADYDVLLANSGEEALKQLARYSDVRMIVSDVNMGVMSGHDLLREVKQHYPHIPMMLITAYASISESVEAMKQGAIDYLVKPFAPQILVETVARHVGVAQLAGDEPVAQAPSSQQLLKLAQRVAQSESTVLIVGESGTGKEVLARYIHNHSPRSHQPFIAINCAAIPENMLEAMLFGHEKGAYTGAHSSAPGKFEQANGGTLLLDEISEMDIGLQAKLLRVLQEREVERLGGRKTIKLDVRVIATSNRDMRSEVSVGKFREDLYYRLSVLPLQWAPLRNRPEDIIPLAEKILLKHAQKQNRKHVTLSSSAQQALLAYPWPGNVRELDNIMQRALILQMGTSIHAEDLGLEGSGLYGQNHQAPISQKPDLLQAANSVHAARQLNGQTVNGQTVNGQHVNSPNVNNQDEYGSRLAIQNAGYPGAGNMHETFASSPVYEKQVPLYENRRGVSDLTVANVDPQHLVLTDPNYVRNPALGNDLKQREFEIIMNTLRMERGSRKNTAERLGISARTLRYKIARLREEGFEITE